LVGTKKGWGPSFAGLRPFSVRSCSSIEIAGGVAGFTLWHPYYRWILFTLREREAMETITLEEARRVIAAAEQKTQ